MKIKTREEIGKIAEKLRRKGKKIVTCNGSFDILHIGHLKFLKEAKKQGNILIVGLNSDISIKKYKNKNRPITKQEYRAQMLAALELVDYITIYDEETPIHFVESVKPNVHVNGEEYGYDCIEAETVKRNNGKIYLVKMYRDFSTTKLIDKIFKTYAK